MFIAHLPAGYLLARAEPRLPMQAVMLGSVLPDLDLLRFYFWDGGAVHHHSYFTHHPAFWAALCLLPNIPRWLVGIVAGTFLHLMLDTVVGAVDWGWPFEGLAGPIVHVPALDGHWIWSFVLHWTFTLEVGICLIALAVWFEGKRKPRR